MKEERYISVQFWHIMNPSYDAAEMLSASIRHHVSVSENERNANQVVSRKPAHDPCVERCRAA